jgi:hypothetical protein
MSLDPFRGIRREIAIALRDGQRRTLYEISKAVGRRTGDIQRTVRQMYAEKLLLADSDTPVRGTLFWFNEDFAEALEQALSDNRPPGQMVYEQRTLQIESPEDVDLYGLLGRSDLNGTISWVVEWGGDGEWLVALQLGIEQSAAARFKDVLRQAGVKCKERRVGQISTADQLRRLIDSVKYAKEVSVG